MIPESAQIQALLDRRLPELVREYCAGSWPALSKNWSAGMEQIMSAASQRGLSSFISRRPVCEGFHLLQEGERYAVCYIERGVCGQAEQFDALEAAFRCWLEHTMQTLMLPRLP